MTIIAHSQGTLTAVNAVHTTACPLRARPSICEVRRSATTAPTASSPAPAAAWPGRCPTATSPTCML
jgi:hypothetical protein